MSELIKAWQAEDGSLHASKHEADRHEDISVMAEVVKAKFPPSKKLGSIGLGDYINAAAKEIAVAFYDAGYRKGDTP